MPTRLERLEEGLRETGYKPKKEVPSIESIERDLSDVFCKLFLLVPSLSIFFATLGLLAWLTVWPWSARVLLVLSSLLGASLVLFLAVTKWILFDKAWRRFFGRNIIPTVIVLRKQGVNISILEEYGLFSRKKFLRARNDLESYENKIMEIIKHL